MSAETRTAIANAATLPPLPDAGPDAPNRTNVTPYFRQVTKSGEGHVTRGQRVPDDSGFGWIETYEVLIPLSPDVAAAEKLLEAIEDDLLAALHPVMVVQSVTPTELIFDNGHSSGVVISGVVPV
jgi:hypothetical protein